MGSNLISQRQEELINRIVNIHLIALDRLGLVEQAAIRIGAAGNLNKHLALKKHHAENLVFCHRYCCELDFERLLTSDAASFWHDMQGISKNLNRREERLDNLFIPDCAISANKSQGEANAIH